MKYYVDCEFDGHNGPLLSIALVREDGESVYSRTTNKAEDPWVQENVIGVMYEAPTPCVMMPEDMVGGSLRFLIGGDHKPVIVADSVVDIARFCKAVSTSNDGSWHSVDGNICFEVHDVAAYPTTLEGAIQHNAWWDAMALREKLK
jgi:hypothetical protein